MLTDIYAAGEDPIPGVTLDTLADTVRGGFSGELRIVRALADVSRELAAHGKAGRSDRAARRRIDRLRRRFCAERAREQGLTCLSQLQRTGVFDGRTSSRRASALDLRRDGWRAAIVVGRVSALRCMLAIARLPLSPRSRCFRSIRSTCEGTIGCRRARCSRCSKACGAAAYCRSISPTGGRRC